jgi:hypothetical protein
MEKRNGVWTSQTRARDAGDIRSLASKIAERSDDSQIREWADRIKRDLEDGR